MHKIKWYTRNGSDMQEFRQFSYDGKHKKSRKT